LNEDYLHDIGISPEHIEHCVSLTFKRFLGGFDPSNYGDFYYQLFESLFTEIRSVIHKREQSLEEVLVDKPESRDPFETGQYENQVEKLKVLVDSLSDEREKMIITLSFGIGGKPSIETEEIAARYGLSKESIEFIKSNALRKLRKSPLAKKLRLDL